MAWDGFVEGGSCDLTRWWSGRLGGGFGLDVD